MTPSLHTLQVYLRRPRTDLISVEEQMNELFRFTRQPSQFSPLLAHWFLASSKSKEDAYLYEAFDANGPTTQALAVLNTKFKGVTDIHAVSLWNGAEDDAESTTLSSRTMTLGPADTVSFSMTVRPEIPDWNIPLAWVRTAIEIWPARAVTFGPQWYSEKKTFPDRPGVGWMLYLPKVLTVQQVPEARALVPVTGSDKKQIGTIIASVTVEAFSLDNTEHIKIANAIEVRLVDQDLLPRHADL